MYSYYCTYKKMLGLLLMLLLLVENGFWLGEDSPTLTSHPCFCLSHLCALAGLLLPYAQTQRICTGEVKEFITSSCLQNQPYPGACRDAVLENSARKHAAVGTKEKMGGGSHAVSSSRRRGPSHIAASALWLSVCSAQLS